jgi:hypothetical protein
MGFEVRRPPLLGLYDVGREELAEAIEVAIVEKMVVETDQLVNREAILRRERS